MRRTIPKPLLLLVPVLLIVLLIGWLLNAAPWSQQNAADVLPTLFAQKRATPQLPAVTATPNAAALEAALRSTDWNERLAAAFTIARRKDISAAQRIQLVSGALEREIASPTTAPPPEGAYLSTGGIIKLELTRSLGEIGSEGFEPLRRIASSAQGELRDRAVLALGFGGDTGVSTQLRALLRGSGDAEIRMAAAHLLGKLKSKDAADDLKAALQDTYRVSTSGTGTPTIYPVREQAAGALLALGIKVERGANGEFKVIEQ